jgi:cytochrome c oxidase cbb3-type subunit 3
MNSMRWTLGGIVFVVVAATVGMFAAGRHSRAAPQSPPQGALQEYVGIVPAAALLRVPVTGVYPGGRPAGLNPDMQNPLANDPDAAQRGMRDFDAFNCSGCHAANGGGGMGPSLSDAVRIYRASPANIFLSIVQGRAAGMPAFGAMLPDRTVWELVAYIQSISEKPNGKFGKTTSLQPQSPSQEQIPAERMQTATPWQFTEPMPRNGAKPGTGPS